MAKKRGNLIGGWAFLVGVVLAVVLALVNIGGAASTVAWILALAGIIVGLLNIADEETTPFLLAGAVLIIASSLGQDAVAVIPMFAKVLNSLLLLFVPATIIVALRHVLGIARR